MEGDRLLDRRARHLRVVGGVCVVAGNARGGDCAVVGHPITECIGREEARDAPLGADDGELLLEVGDDAAHRDGARVRPGGATDSPRRMSIGIIKTRANHARTSFGATLSTRSAGGWCIRMTGT